MTKPATSAETNTADQSPLKLRRIGTKRTPFINVQPQRVWLDNATRERLTRLHSRISEGLQMDATLSVLLRVALADLEKKVAEVVPSGPTAELMIQTQEALALKVALFTAARGQL